MIIRNKSNKPIGIGIAGDSPVVLMPDEETYVPNDCADTNGIKTLERLDLIECRADPVRADKPEPVADEKPVEPKPVEEPAKEKKPAAKKSKAKAE